MNSHELGARLLKLPDVPVQVYVSERGWPDDLDIEPDDIEVLKNDDGSPKVIRLWPV